MNYKRLAFPVFILFCILLCNACRPKQLDVADFMDSESVDDLMPAIRKALDKAKEMHSNTLILPEGKFFVKADAAYERFCFVSNNDEGLKRIAFDLTDFQQFEIKGNNTRLYFVGFVIPFLINQSNDIKISGISIDYTTPFHSEAEVINVTDSYFDVKIDENEFPYRIDACGSLVFDNKPTGYESCDMMLEFDKLKKEPAHYADDHWIDKRFKASKLSNNTVRIFLAGIAPKVGNVMIFGPKHRLNPAFIITDSENLCLRNINVYHAGGMAFVAQRSGNIELNESQVCLSPKSKRILSATADATHFSNCHGYIKLLNCRFENQKDDATNIHGIYAQIKSIDNMHQITVQLVHPQQYGFHFYKPGTRLECVNHSDLITYDTLLVESVQIVNKQYAKLNFKEALPQDLREGDVLADIDSQPEVLIEKCVIQNNRARGILLGSRARTLIKNNVFHSAGAAIYFEGDGSYWFEQSGVRDVEICNNLFLNCNYGSKGWGQACIAVGSGIRENQLHSRYHSNINIHNNVFKGFDTRLLNMYCVDNLCFKNNSFVKTTDYTSDFDASPYFQIVNCSNVEIDSLEYE